MTPTADSIADEVLQFVCNRVNVTLGTRLAIRNFIAEKVSPLAPHAQSALNFDGDKEALKGQSVAILKLLRERRSLGATNAEINKLAMKHTSRISDLRAEGWKIEATRESGRTWRYRLHPTDY